MKASDLKISDNKNSIVVYDVIELKAVACGGCYGCFFEEHKQGEICMYIPCLSYQRQDDNSVIFLRLDEMAEAVLR